jgi:hypothetical protein
MTLDKLKDLYGVPQGNADDDLVPNREAVFRAISAGLVPQARCSFDRTLSDNDAEDRIEFENSGGKLVLEEGNEELCDQHTETPYEIRIADFTSHENLAFDEEEQLHFPARKEPEGPGYTVELELGSDRHEGIVSHASGKMKLVSAWKSGESEELFEGMIMWDATFEMKYWKRGDRTESWAVAFWAVRSKPGMDVGDLE